MSQQIKVCGVCLCVHFLTVLHASMHTHTCMSTHPHEHVRMYMYIGVGTGGARGAIAPPTL